MQRLGQLRERLRAMSLLGLALIVLASALAVVVVPILVLYDSGSRMRSEQFVSTPQFVLWLLILSGQAAIWVAAAAYVIPTVRRRLGELRRRRVLSSSAAAAIAASGLALALVAVLFNFGPALGLFDEVESSHIPTGDKWPLAHHTKKMPTLAAFGFAIGLLAIVGMWLTTVAFQDLARHAKGRRSWVRRFVTLRSELTALLAVAGALIGLATLSSGALREAVLAANDEPFYRSRTLACLERNLARDGSVSAETRRAARTDLEELVEAYPGCPRLRFDRRYVLGYGLLFSGVLGIAFMPSFFAMRQAGDRLRNRTYPLPQPTAPKPFFESVENRKKLDDLLQTSLRGSAAFKAGAAILTPLAASLISTLIPT